jgi:Zn-dependent M28 family amino/carboxypeptidase
MQRRSLLPVLALLAACADTPTETAIPPTAEAPADEIVDCALQNNNTVEKLTACVTLDGVRAHQAAFQAIADANGGVRTPGLPGGVATEAYIEDVLTQAGYDVTLVPFSYRLNYPLGPSTLAQTAPTPTTYTYEVDFQTFGDSPAGTASGLVVPVDLDLGLANASTSGCEIEDFVGFPPGSIALLQRGACFFRDKAENAAAAGAAAVIIFNQGNNSDRLGLINGGVTEAYQGGIPVLDATYALGVELSAGVSVSLFANRFDQDVTSNTVIAESSSGADDNVVLASSQGGLSTASPTINLAGSGDAVLLEVARQMRRTKPRNKVRFAFFLAGFQQREAYLDQLVDDDELRHIALALDFEALGSPNYANFVYDGDGSDTGFPGPDGSEAIEALFRDFYANRGQESEDSEFTPSAALYFGARGLPTGGISGGLFRIKTPEQAALYGGVAGEQFDPCFDLACDTFDNVSLEALDVNSDAAATAILTYAMSTESVNGRKGKGNFGTPNGPPEDRGMPEEEGVTR